MAWKLKSAKKSTAIEAANDALRSTVSEIILNVEKRGDAALRDYSIKFVGGAGRALVVRNQPSDILTEESKKGANRRKEGKEKYTEIKV